jgi:hypothetical protein
MYTLTTGSFVIRDADGAHIPDDPRNADWQLYQAWLGAGNTPTPAAATVTPAPTLTFLQFMALFTAAEQAAIVGSSDTQVKLFVVMAAGAGGLQLDNAEVVAGVTYLQSIALLTAPRAAAVLAGDAPPAA